MYRKIFRTGLLAVAFILATGVTLYAGKTIDKIEFPPLGEPELPEVEMINLDNGMVLYLLEDHKLPLINARVRLAAGGYLDPPDKVGLASITGTVLRTGGTERMTGDEIDAALESIGASIEFSIGTTSGSGSMNILSDYVDTGLEIMADILRRPVFDEDKIDLARTQQRSAISRRNDKPLQICVREFRKIIYGSDSPYGRHTEYASIDAVAREDLIAFHQSKITPENVSLGIWGDFDSEEMKGKITKLFGEWTSGTGRVPALPGVEYDFKPSIHYIEKKNINQSNILLGHIGGLMDDPDYFPMIVMNNVLGGSFGSRLFNEVRSRQGLAYDVWGSFTANIAYPGVYYNSCVTKSESTVQAINSMIEETRRMQTDLAARDEMRRGKEGYLNSFVFKFDDQGKNISRIMAYDYYNFPRDFLFTAKRNVEKVTAEDVMRVAQERLHPDAFHIVVVGNGDEFGEPLSVLGEVDTIDVTIPTGEAEEEIAISEETLAKGMGLLKQAADACGGIGNFKKVKAISSKSTVSLVTPQGEFAIESSTLLVLPDREKSVLNTPMGEIITVNDGEGGWMKQGANIVDLAADQIDDARKEQFRSTYLLFQSVDDPQFRAVYVSTEELNGRPVDIIKIISPDDKMSFKLALDAESHIPVGKMYFGKTMMGPGNLTQLVSDYREVSGIKVPFSVIIESAGNKIADVKLKELLVNPEIPEGTFDKP